MSCEGVAFPGHTAHPEFALQPIATASCGADFAAGLLAEAHARGINTVIETAFYVPWSHAEKVLRYVDVILHDHKLTGPVTAQEVDRGEQQTHPREHQGCVRGGPRNDVHRPNPADPRRERHKALIRAVLAFIKSHRNLVDSEPLPYMRFGERTYGSLGKVHEMQNFEPPTSELLARLGAIIDEAFRARAAAGGIAAEEEGRAIGPRPLLPVAVATAD